MSVTKAVRRLYTAAIVTRFPEGWRVLAEKGVLFSPVFPAAHKNYTALSSISERDRTTTGAIAVTMMSRAAAAPSSTTPREAFS